VRVRTVFSSLVVAGLWTGLASGAADAQTVACVDRDSLLPALMTLAYQGGDAGTLQVQASFGDMRLPAAKRTGQTTTEGGRPFAAFDIRASGTAPTKMPDRPAFEACVKRRVAGEANKDLVAEVSLACRSNILPGDAPVQTRVTIAVAATKPDAIEVHVTRTYEEPSAPEAGPLTIEMPRPTCILKP